MAGSTDKSRTVTQRGTLESRSALQARVALPTRPARRPAREETEEARNQSAPSPSAAGRRRRAPSSGSGRCPERRLNEPYWFAPDP